MLSGLVALALMTSSLGMHQANEPPPSPIKPNRDPDSAKYPLLFQSDFSKPESIKQFEFTDPRAWRIAQTPEGPALELFGKSDYAPKHRSPLNIALVAGKSFGDFILEVEAQSTVKPYNHQDLCVFLGVQSPDRFYYAHLAVKPDPHAHNIFLVKDAPRVAIAKKTTDGVTWKENGWHKIRIERKVAEGSIKVYFDDMSQPIMVAEDKSHGAGGIGVGSFDDKGRFRNLKVWGPEMTSREGPWFSAKK